MFITKHWLRQLLRSGATATCTATALTLLLALSACGATTSSRNIRTGGLVALIDITAERPDQTVVSADMVVGGRNSNTHVVLEGGDRLVASCGDEELEMSSVGNGSYAARFARSEGEFVVGLVRTDDEEAPRSVGTLPASFEITSTYGSAATSRANDALTITWTPGGTDALVSIELEGDCIHSDDFELGGDPGTFTIEAGKITAWKSQEKETCNVALRVVQTKQGEPDPALGADSSVVLRQIRSTRFVSAP